MESLKRPSKKLEKNLRARFEAMSPRTAIIKAGRENLRRLIDDVLEGEEGILLRGGKHVARLAPLETEMPPLPDLERFRDSIHVEGRAMSAEVVSARTDE